MNPRDPQQLRTFVRYQAGVMRTLIEKGDEPMATAFFIDLQGKPRIALMALHAQEDKEPMRRHFRSQADRMGVVAAVTVADVYYREIDRKALGVEGAEQELEQGLRYGLKNAPGRKEQLFATLYTRELHEAFYFPYHRDGAHLIWEPERREDYLDPNESGEVDDPWDPWDYLRKKRAA